MSNSVQRRQRPSVGSDLARREARTWCSVAWLKRRTDYLKLCAPSYTLSPPAYCLLHTACRVCSLLLLMLLAIAAAHSCCWP